MVMSRILTFCDKCNGLVFHTGKRKQKGYVCERCGNLKGTYAAELERRVSRLDK